MLVQRLVFLAGSVLLATYLGCGGSGHRSANGSVNVRLVDGPTSAYSEINLNIQRVEVASAGSGWMTISTPNKTCNLLALTGGVSASLAEGATLAAGHYTQMRLVLGSGNTLKLSDGTVANLTTPSGLQSGIKIIASFDVVAGTTRDVVIDFDGAHSIQVVATGSSTKYILRPTVRAVDVMATGSISGVMSDSSGAALAGAEVTAQRLDASGRAFVVRRAYTGADGSYKLDLLPAGGSFHVVSQPVVAGQAYQARASAAFAVSSATPTFTYSASFTAVALTGSVSGTITPTATDAQHDVVDLMQSLSAGGGASASFIVRSRVASVAAAETYSFDLVPTGAYLAGATRYTLNADGSLSASESSPMALTVNAALSTRADFSF